MRAIKVGDLQAISAREFPGRAAAKAGIWISVFAAIEDETTLSQCANIFERPDGHEWEQAIRTVLHHDATEEVNVLARGSLVLDAVDPKSMKVLWRAAAIADVALDVSDTESNVEPI